MLAFLQKLFEADEANSGLSEASIPLACAALLLEVSRADFDQDAAEREHIEQLIQKKFSLDASQLQALLEEAGNTLEQGTDLYPFTRLLNDHCDETQKYALIEAAWQVAHADGRIDKYEEALIRRIAELIYLPHSLFIKARHRAAEGAG